MGDSYSITVIITTHGSFSEAAAVLNSITEYTDQLNLANPNTEIVAVSLMKSDELEINNAETT